MIIVFFFVKFFDYDMFVYVLFYMLFVFVDDVLELIYGLCKLLL